jgi:hypothetical protein
MAEHDPLWGVKAAPTAGEPGEKPMDSPRCLNGEAGFYGNCSILWTIWRL